MDLTTDCDPVGFLFESASEKVAAHRAGTDVFDGETPIAERRSGIYPRRGKQTGSAPSQTQLGRRRITYIEKTGNWELANWHHGRKATRVSTLRIGDGDLVLEHEKMLKLLSNGSSLKAHP